MTDPYAARTVAAWLGYVHEHAIAQHLAGIVNIAAPTIANGSRPKWTSRCFTLAQIDDAGRKAVVGSDAALNIYYRVHLLDAPVEQWERGKGVQTRWVTHIAADVDIDGPGHKPPAGKRLPSDNEAIGLIDATLPPSAIVASGGGFYPVWRLAEPFEIATTADRERYKNLGRRLDAALGSHGCHVDATALDLARVIRPPGVVNQKQGRDPRPVVILRGWCDGAGDFTIDQLEAQLPQVEPKTVKAKAAHATPSNSPAPWDLFTSRYDIEDVLAADPKHEWEDVGLRGGMPAWRYVGSSSDYSIKQGDDAIIVWSGTIAADLGIEPGDGVTLWALACKLAGVDPTQAARAYPK